MEGYGDVPRELPPAVSDDPVAFAGAILSILEAPGVYEARAQRLQEWAMRHFSFATSVQQVAGLYSRGQRRRRSVHEGWASWGCAISGSLTSQDVDRRVTATNDLDDSCDLLAHYGLGVVYG